MRVISGAARGRRLKEIPGKDTRPTTDKVKESLFNIIQFELEGRRVLDLFGGTGQLGIEALSRGAAQCTFVDENRQAVAVIRENLRALELESRSSVHQQDAVSFLSACRGKYDIILLDPPYESDLLERCLHAVTKFDILAEYGIIICESAADRRLALPEMLSGSLREYRYGKIKLTVCRRQEGVEE